MITSAAFLFIFFASYCNAQVVSHIDSKFMDDTYADYNSIPKLDDTKVFGPNALRDFYVVMVFGLLTLQLNLFGSLYVIYRTYLQWKRSERNTVSLSIRFPFYVALTDVFLSLAYILNLGHTFLWKLPWPNPACRIIGASAISLFTLNMFLVGIVALTTWLYVCKEYNLEFGSYDYRLWAVTLALSIVIFCFSIGKSGQQKYWCAGRHHSVLVPITMIIFIFLILLTILVCYLKVLLKIRSNDDSLIFSRYQRARIEKRALRKLISYIFIYILQFIPLLAYNSFIIIEFEHVLLHVLAITTVNFGGIGNFVQFVINEGLSSHSASPMTKEQNLPPTNSFVPEERQEIEDSIDEKSAATPNLTSEVPEVVVNEEKIKEISDVDLKINMDNIDSDNEEVFQDSLTIFDGTTLITASSSDILLKHDDDFVQELLE